MPFRRLLLGLLLAGLAVLPGLPSATAAEFVAAIPFTDFAAADHLPVLGGSLDVRSPAGGSPAIMHKVAGFQVDGLAVVCWQYPCHEAQGPLVVRVLDGSSVALRFPETGFLHLRAEHAVATPVALDGERAGFAGLSAALRLAPSLSAATRGGVLTVDPEVLQPAPDGVVPAQGPAGTPPVLAPFLQAPDPDDGDAAVLATLSPASRIEVLDGGRLVHQAKGYAGLLLQGAIHVEAVEAEAFVVPCAVRCDLVVVDRDATADLGAAAAMLLELVQLAQGTPLPGFELGPFGDLLNPVADGVFVDFPLVEDPAEFSVANLTVVRFGRFEASLYPGAPASSGSGPLVIQSGDVRGSPEFVGGPYFGMPLWSYVLWGLALVAIVGAAALRSPKRNATWDRLQWVGRTLGAVALVALVVVWHLNFGRVLGVDSLTPGLGSGTRFLVVVVEGGTLLAMTFMVVLPTRLLLSRGFRIAGQGRFMGLAGPLASLVGILAGTPLLLGFLDLALAIFR
ncbi:MAG: hypothetical protein ACYC2H_02325 [Thermoplasmatota archaeon]